MGDLIAKTISGGQTDESGGKADRFYRTVWRSELIQAVGTGTELGALTEVADFGERLREAPGGLRVGSAFLVNTSF